MVKLFYDGCDIKKFGTYPNIVGFTTNPTIMKQSGQSNYKTFYEANKEYINGRPISMQVFSDDPNEIADQAEKISSLGTNTIVKVPVVTSKGESNLPVIRRILEKGIPVNITAVFAKIQIDQIYMKLANVSTNFIVSIFAGRISDTGLDPKDIVKYAVDTFTACSNVQILWAGVKDNLIIKNSDDIGCHIATLPDSILLRINRLGQPLENLSKDTVFSFNKDASDIILSIL
jgi:transaldolase